MRELEDNDEASLYSCALEGVKVKTEGESEAFGN